MERKEKKKKDWNMFTFPPLSLVLKYDVSLLIVVEYKGLETAVCLKF